MMANKILTLHPEGKAGVNIDADKYHQIRRAILERVEKAGEIGFQELAQSLKVELKDTFEGSVSWYVTTVKLDLEARGALICLRKKGGQRIRLASHP